MAQKYAVYRLKKVSSKKEYVVESASVNNTLKAAYDELAMWDEDLDGPVWYNRKINDTVAYELHDRALYVPNWTEVTDKQGNTYEKLLGVNARYRIYIIDRYPCPYSHYRIRKTVFDDIEFVGVE